MYLSVAEADAAAGVEAIVSGDMFDVDLYFIDDEDLVGSQCCYGGPEDGYGGCDDSEVDFEDGEDIDDGCVEGHV